MAWPCLVGIAVFGLILGCVVGMTSIGKGLIGTPGLILLGVSSTSSVGTMGFAGVFMMISSTIKHYQHRNVDLKTVLAFSITAVPLSYIFARYKAQINDVVPLTAIIAGAIILSVITLVHRFFISKKDPDAETFEGTGIVAPLLLGVVLGFFIGATSISGSLIVIAFMLILKMPEKLAIGTTNFVAIFSLIAASVAHVMSGHVDWVVFAVFTPTVMVGAYVGAHLTHVTPKKPLRIIILVLLVIAALAIIFKNGTHEAPCSEHERPNQKVDRQVQPQPISPAPRAFHAYSDHPR